VTSLSWDSVLAWRLERQHLTARAPRAAALEVVSDICGLHAQVASCAELTLWARVEGLEPGDVPRMLWEERALVKTWAMRGTLHLLVAAELPRYVGALSRLRPRHHVPAWLRAHGLEREQAEAMLGAIAAALDGTALTREELAAAVAERDAEAVLPAARRERVYRPQGWLSPVLLAGGRIARVWEHERKGRRIEVTVEPFGRVDADVKAGAETEAERLAGFLDGELRLRWT
jgi:hypothetical protein